MSVTRAAVDVTTWTDTTQHRQEAVTGHFLSTLSTLGIQSYFASNTRRGPWDTKLNKPRSHLQEAHNPAESDHIRTPLASSNRILYPDCIKR